MAASRHRAGPPSFGPLHALAIMFRRARKRPQRRTTLRPLVSELRLGAGPGGWVCQPTFLHSGEKIQIANPRIVPAIGGFFSLNLGTVCADIPLLGF